LFGLTDQVLTREFLLAGGDFAVSVVVVDEHFLFGHVEFSLFDLGFSGVPWVQFKLLSHFLDNAIFFEVLVLNRQVLLVFFLILLVGYGTVDETIFTAFVVLEGFVADLFFSVDETVLYSVVPEVEFAGVAINLDKFLPVLRTCVLTVGFKMFDQFEFVWETSSYDQLINPILVVRSDFFGDYSAVVLIQGDLFN